MESAESVVVNLSAAAYSVNPSSSTATVTITDNEPTISVTAWDSNAAEENTDPGTFVFYHDGWVTSQSVTLYLWYSDTASSGSDYQTPPSTVVIPAGLTSTSVTITPIDDQEVESTENVVVNLTASGYAVNPSMSTATVTITDNEPEISVSSSLDDQASEEAAETYGTATYVFSHSGSVTSQSVTLYLWYDGTATSGLDYQTLPSTVVIPASQTSTSVTVTPIDDQEIESAETVVVHLTASGYTVNPTYSTATVTIADNEPEISVTVSDADAYERGADTGTFVIGHDGSKTTQTVTVLYTLVTPTPPAQEATNGTDYMTLTYSVTIPAGQISATVTILPLDDQVHEGDELVILSLTSNGTYTINSASSSATVTIHDDDPIPSTPDNKQAQNMGCSCECACSGGTSTSTSKADGSGGSTNPATRENIANKPHPIVTVETSLTSTDPLPDLVTAQRSCPFCAHRRRRSDEGAWLISVSGRISEEGWRWWRLPRDAAGVAHPLGIGRR